MKILNEKTFINQETHYNDLCFVRIGGISQLDNSHILTKDNDNTIVFGYITSGKASLEEQGIIYTISKGSSFILSNQYENRIFSNGKAFSMIWLKCQGTLLNTMLDMYFKDYSPIISNYNSEKNFKEIFSLLSRNIGAKANDAISLILHHVIIANKNNLVVKPNKSSKKDTSIEHQIETYIVNHIKEKISIQDLADKFSLSKSQINKIFKDKFNVSPYTYFLDKKIATSKLILKQSDVSIDEISVELSFNDRNHFSKIFTQKVGMSPAFYRKYGE